jgi:hypothetical protein
VLSENLERVRTRPSDSGDDSMKYQITARALLSETYTLNCTDDVENT